MRHSGIVLLVALFIPDKFDLRLHASGAKFYSGWNVRFGMENGMNSIRNELQLNRDSCKQIQVNPLLFEQKWNELDPE